MLIENACLGLVITLSLNSWAVFFFSHVCVLGTDKSRLDCVVSCVVKVVRFQGYSIVKWFDFSF